MEGRSSDQDRGMTDEFFYIIFHNLLDSVVGIRQGWRHEQEADAICSVCVCVGVCQTDPAQTPHFFCPPSTGPSDSSQPDLEAVGAAAWQSWRPALFIRLCHTHAHAYTQNTLTNGYDSVLRSL